MPKISYHCEGLLRQEVHCESGSTLLNASLGNKVPHYHACNGAGKCTTCRVLILSGEENLTPPTEAEKAIIEEKNWPAKVRLACQTKVLGDVVIRRLVIDNVDLSLAESAGHSAAAIGYERKLVIMFCDIANFTQFSSEHYPYDVVHLLNRYYKEIGEPILANQGYIDKYMGDGLMVLFGLEEDDPVENCLNAVRASLRMLMRLEKLNKCVSKNFNHEFKIRIGLHYGSVIVGEIGHPSKRQLTVLGDTVNVASRIESENKAFDTKLLASEQFLQFVRDNIETGISVKTLLRGKDYQHTLHEIKRFKVVDPSFVMQSIPDKVDINIDKFTAFFYKRLFELDPNLRSLFGKYNRQGQKQMLLTTLQLCAKAFTQFDDIAPKLKQMGQRHQMEWYVKPIYYDTMKTALLESFRAFCGEDFTVEVEQLWVKSYQIIVKGMLAGISDNS